jgi:hypothetical protein
MLLERDGMQNDNQNEAEKELLIKGITDRFSNLPTRLYLIRQALAQDPRLINSRIQYGETALSLALISPHTPLAIIQCLLEAGAALNTRNERSETALETALLCRQARPEIIEYLMTQGADFNAQDDSGASLLRRVIRKDNSQIQMVKRLVEAGAGLEDDLDRMWGLNILHTSAEYGRVDILRYFAELERALPLWNAKNRAGQTIQDYVASTMRWNRKVNPQTLEVIQQCSEQATRAHQAQSQKRLQTFFMGTLRRGRSSSMVTVLPVDVLGIIAAQVIAPSAERQPPRAGGQRQGR